MEKSPAKIPFNNNVLNALIDDLDMGVLVFVNNKIVFKNKFIINEFGQDNYLRLLFKEDLQYENDRFDDFMLKNIESESTLHIKNTMYHIKFNIRKITHYKKAHVITLFKMNNTSFKDILLANFTHEIRTPLSGITGMLTLLEDTHLNTEQIDYIEMIKECSFNLMTVVNDILDYSKLESNKMNLDIKCINLLKCIESTTDIILGKLYQKNDIVLFNYNIDNKVPKNIMIDSNRLKQVLLNLLSNSIKFTTHGSITLDIALDGNDHLQFKVTDTGCGIKKKDFPLLFKSFCQVDQLTNRVQQGTGLGLAISKYIINLMKGKIWLDYSKEYTGSCFCFTIPIEQCTCISTSEINTNDNILKNINVLILDDNLHNRISLTGLVNKWGMNPITFSTSEEALYYLKMYPDKINIGLIDICMPTINGYDFATKLNEQLITNNEINNEKSKNLPLIALSSINKNNGIKSYNDKLFKHYILKPIKESKLKTLMIDIIQNSQFSNKKPISIEKLNDNSTIKILVVEDIYINQRVIIQFLKKLGYSLIDVAENGNECLDILKLNYYDIILLDIRLPILDGEQVFRYIKEYYNNNSDQKLFKNKTIPYIIALTAYCLIDDYTKYISLGFNDYLSKPVNINQLKDALDRYTYK